MDDVAAIIATGRGITYTHGVLLALSERNVPLVICNEKFLPSAWLWPMEGHHVQAMRMSAQLEAKQPLKKRMWQDLVKAKIGNQAAVLNSFGRPSEQVKEMTRRVRSGDIGNIEAAAAQRYWLFLFAHDFKRSRRGVWPNTLLNYGYTVIRACSARAIAAVGLHPSLGIHHRNRFDYLQLADDIMEPFRPIVDYRVVSMIEEGATEITDDCKKELALIPSMDVLTSSGATPVMTCIHRLAASVARSYMEKKNCLNLPPNLLPMDFKNKVVE